VLNIASREASGLGIATVYRNIKAFLGDGWLVPVDLPGEAPRYEIASRTRHDHFYCKSCGKVYDVGVCDIVTRKVLPRGFRLQGHQTLLFGSCSDCLTWYRRSPIGSKESRRRGNSCRASKVAAAST
jgi:Fur family ferric uptake transcriptional regulator